MTVIYGIKNCDTVKKTLGWLEAHKVDFTFHDYKKEGVPEDIVKQALTEHGWENVINKRGTTWRQLPAAVRDKTDQENAWEIMRENASLIKRPLLHHQGETYLGFDEAAYKKIFG